MLDILLMSEQSGLIGQHLRRHTSNHRLGICLEVLILVAASFPTVTATTSTTFASAVATAATAATLIIIIVALAATITIIIASSVATLALCTTNFTTASSTICVSLLVILILILATAIFPLRLRFRGFCLCRLKSRLRCRVASLMNLPEVYWFRRGLTRLLLVTGIVHNLLPVHDTAFGWSMFARCCRTRRCLCRRLLLPRLIDRLALVPFLVIRFLCHFILIRWLIWSSLSYFLFIILSLGKGEVVKMETY